jgi:predicted Zn-dependent protease
VREAYQRMARSFHPDAHHDPALADLKDKIVAVFIRVGEIHGILSDQHRRGAYEFELNRKAEATRRDEARRATASAPPPPDPVLLLKKAQAFLAAGKAGDAVHLLEEAVPLTRGRMKTRARVILAQAYLSNPKWTRDAQEALERALQEDPEHPETYPLLGSVYEKAGLKARAAGIYRRGLALKPDWPELAASLARVTSG